jgi:hypothetical protein
MIVSTRTVVVLGRRPSFAIDGLRAGLRENDELVVLSLGYPVTAAQRGVLLRAQDLAAEVGAWFDATLVLSTDEMLERVQTEDQVHVAARGSRGRRLRKALAASRG